MQFDIDRAAGLAVGHLVGRGAILLRLAGLHAEGEHRLMAALRLFGGDEHVLIAGHAVIRLGIQSAAGDALDHAGRKARTLQVLHQREELARLHGLHHDAVHHLALDRHHQPQVRALRRGAGIGRLKDHRQHMMRMRKLEQIIPCLRAHRRIPGHALAAQACAQRFQEQFSDQTRFSHHFISGRISTTTISGTLLILGTPPRLPSPRESTITRWRSCE